MKPLDRIWLGENPAVPLISQATPPASKMLLSAAVSYPRDAAVLPYAGCARLFDGCSPASTGNRYIGQMFAPGAAQAQGVIVRVVQMGSLTSTCPDGMGGLGGPYNNLSWTATGGTTGANVVTTNAQADANGLDYFATYDRSFGYGMTNQQQIVVTANKIDNSPSATEDRMYTVQTIGHPYVEPMFITCAAGYTVYVSQRIGDLESL